MGRQFVWPELVCSACSSWMQRLGVWVKFHGHFWLIKLQTKAWNVWCWTVISCSVESVWALWNAATVEYLQCGPQNLLTPQCGPLMGEILLKSETPSMWALKFMLKYGPLIFTGSGTPSMCRTFSNVPQTWRKTLLVESVNVDIIHLQDSTGHCV